MRLLKRRVPSKADRDRFANRVVTPLTGYRIAPCPEDGVVDIQSRSVFGMFMPDDIAACEVDGRTRRIAVDEGGARDEAEIGSS